MFKNSGLHFASLKKPGWRGEMSTARSAVSAMGSSARLLGSFTIALSLVSICACPVRAQSSWQSDGPSTRAQSAPKTEAAPEKSERAENHNQKSTSKPTKSETKDGVTVERNSDGTVDAYDAGDMAEDASASGSGASATNEKGQYTGIVNGVRYRPGTTPYSRNSGGVTVRRNSDGSIETSDEAETYHWVGSPSGMPSAHRASRARKGKPSAHASSSNARAAAKAPAKKSK